MIPLVKLSWTFWHSECKVLAEMDSPMEISLLVQKLLHIQTEWVKTHGERCWCEVDFNHRYITMWTVSDYSEIRFCPEHCSRFKQKRADLLANTDGLPWSSRQLKITVLLSINRYFCMTDYPVHFDPIRELLGSDCNRVHFDWTDWFLLISVHYHFHGISELLTKNNYKIVLVQNIHLISFNS